jgi:hypothetical protein
MRPYSGTITTIAEREAAYQAFPDVVLTPSGRLLVTFRESDEHSATWTRIMLTASSDAGATWSLPAEHHRLSQQEDGWTWNCPRLSLLSDGRIALICDRRDKPRDRSCTWVNVIWWSSDDGRTWSEPQDTGCVGYVPDRVVELDDGTLVLGLQHWDANAERLIQRVFRSEDGGASWQGPVVIAAHRDYHLCEGSIAQLPSGDLLCFMRENSGKRYPTFASRSRDRGHTWSSITPTDMIGHRPAAGMMLDGRILVTFRDVGGSHSFCAWLGDETGHGRILRIEDDTSGRHADYGYSGWVLLPDGRVFVAYYLRGDAPNPRIRGCYLTERDFA